MPNEINLLDPLGIGKVVKTQVDQMATQAGLPQTPKIPEVKSAAVTNVLDPLGIFTRNNPLRNIPGYSRERY